MLMTCDGFVQTNISALGKGLGFISFVLLVTAVNGMPAWTPYVSSELLPQYGLAVMRSNRWPGAVAFAKDR